MRITAYEPPSRAQIFRILTYFREISGGMGINPFKLNKRKREEIIWSYLMGMI